MELAFVTYIAIVSLTLCICMYIDKQRAIHKEWRISEATLLTLGFAGGAIGGVLAMYLFRHKTRKNTFAFSFPLLAAVHVYIIVQLLN